MIPKEEFTKKMCKWLESYLIKKYANEYNVQVVLPKSNLSKLPIESLKRIEGYSLLDFKPDILGILSHKTNHTIRLVFLNRSMSAISLKEIGEMNCYSRLANPIQSFIVSPRGLPNEVNLLLLNSDTEKNLLEYNNTSIIVFRWDVEKAKVDDKSIFPLSKRRFE